MEATGGLTGLLDVRSFFSEGRGVSSPRRLVRSAAAQGYSALALTDDLSVGGVVELQQNAREAGITPIVGATVPLETPHGTYPIALLCSSRQGYQNLNELITLCRYDGQEAVSMTQLHDLADDLQLLTGGRHGFPTRLLAARRQRSLEELLQELSSLMRGRLYVQLYFDHHPWDARRAGLLRQLAHELKLTAVAAPQIHYAAAEDFPLYDALVCAREGIDVATPHRARPQTRANWLKTPAQWAQVLPWRDALLNTAELCRELHFDLQPQHMVPPRVHVPEGHTADSYLSELCLRNLPRMYPQPQRQQQARELLEKELGIIREQRFPELFLACREIVDYCDRHGILNSARGSAAASITCRLLDISKIDPLEHDLLFERFLFQGQKSAPDIDIDISSERRDEVLAWIERRYGGQAGAWCEAMVSNRITYRTPLALQDLGRAVGLPPPLRNKISRTLGRDYRRLAPRDLRRADAQLSEVLGEAPVKETLYKVLERMEKSHFRHFAPHSGGVVLSEQPLSWYSPQYRSANGIRALQFDKDDVEWLGLIKLDVLSLRALSALEEAVEEVYRCNGVLLDVWNLPQEDAVWDMIGEGDTMTLFQIESPGQMSLSTVLKPRNLQELADQEALHRPGPIQSGSKQPYVARKLGREQPVYVHEALRPILQKTHGVIVYQEQVVRIAHFIAGMDWPEADRFRKKVQKYDDEEAQEMREAFVDGVLRTLPDATPEQAAAMFEQCAAFTGFGFAESHSASFAHITYATAWLLLHYPAEWFAVFFTVHPGMWPRETLRMACKRKGVELLGLDVNRSRAAFRVERLPDGRKGVRMAFTAIKGMPLELAQDIRWEALRRPFRDVADFLSRIEISSDLLEALVRAGAFDCVQERRQALFDAYALAATTGPAQQPPLFSLQPERPLLQPLDSQERLAWDIELTGMSSSKLHPLDHLRSQLRELGAVPLSLVRTGRTRTAGLVVGVQKPPTAGGVAFIMLEDGERLAQLIVRPELWQQEYRTLRDSKLLLVEGQARASGLTLSITAETVASAEPGPARSYARSPW